MKMSLPLPLLLLSLATSTGAFAPVQFRTASQPSLPTSLGSTLAADAPTMRFDDGDDDRRKMKVNGSAAATSTSSTATSSSAPKASTSGKGKGALSMQIDELGEVLGGRGRAKIAWDCYNIGIDPVNFFGPVIKLGHDDYESVCNLLPSKRRNQKLGVDAVRTLQSMYPAGLIDGGVATLTHVSRSADRTTKLLLRLADGLQVETVIIPWQNQRSTLCISSQVGCKQGCKFCATGKMGKLRDLTSDEILAQMFFAKKVCRLEGLSDVTNIVFMGMGEPADNAENVKTAVDVLTTRELYSLSAGKVTVSTVGPTPDSFRTFAKSRCQIAWSVHAANDDLRKKLVPTTKYSMAELRKGLIDTLNSRPYNFRATMLEVALMADVNDTDEAADELAEFSREIVNQVENCRLIVNLIPFNDIGQDLYRKPSPEAVLNFQSRLQSKNLFTHIRTTRGDDKTAACGQLATTKADLANKRP